MTVFPAIAYAESTEPQPTPAGAPVAYVQPTESVSGPITCPAGSVTTAEGHYHWLGAGSSTDIVVVYAEMQVTNPSVPHGGNHFYASRIMVKNDAGTVWTEVGWAELGWKEDKQYVYVWDTNDRLWHLFGQYPISSGTWITVKIRYAGPSYPGKWEPMLLWGGSWVVLDRPYMGWEQAPAVEQTGEIYTPNDVDFAIQQTYFRNVKVQKLGQTLVNWDTTSMPDTTSRPEVQDRYRLYFDNRWYYWHIWYV